jgi:hypothetical protein
MTATGIFGLIRTNIGRRVQSLASWQVSQEIKCGAASFPRVESKDRTLSG